MGRQEKKCQISQNYILHMRFSEIYLCFHNNLVKFDIHFLRLTWEIWQFEISLMVFMPKILISLLIMLLPILICNYTWEITKLPWQHSLCVTAKMAAKFFNTMNEDVRALKDDLVNLNTWKSRSNLENIRIWTKLV